MGINLHVRSFTKKLLMPGQSGLQLAGADQLAGAEWLALGILAGASHPMAVDSGSLLLAKSISDAITPA